jgi:hypothetical protein
VRDFLGFTLLLRVVGDCDKRMEFISMRAKIYGSNRVVRNS